jgi:hypothetical protein
MKQRKVALLATILVAAVLSGGWACSAGSYAKAGQLAKDFASTVLAAQEVEIAAHASGYVDDNTHLAIQNELLQIADAGQRLDLAINQTHDASGAAAQVTVIRSLLTDLSTTKLVGIKNQNSQLAVKSALLLCQTTIDSIAAFGGK